MRRLFWVAVGATVTVVAARRLGSSVSGLVPRDAAELAGSAARAGRSVRGVVGELRAGMAEREAQLRADLLGDADIEELRAERARRRAATDAPERPGTHRAADGRGRRSTRGWADAPTEDPSDDEGDLPYTFY